MRSASTSPSLVSFSRSSSAHQCPHLKSYHPISHRGSNMSPAGPVGYFVIDSLDSLLLTNSTDEYKRARDWVEKLSFDLDDKYHTFEVSSDTTLRDALLS